MTLNARTGHGRCQEALSHCFPPEQVPKGILSFLHNHNTTVNAVMVNNEPQKDSGKGYLSRNLFAGVWFGTDFDKVFCLTGSVHCGMSRPNARGACHFRACAPVRRCSCHGQIQVDLQKECRPQRQDGRAEPAFLYISGERNYRSISGFFSGRRAVFLLRRTQCVMLAAAA